MAYKAQDQVDPLDYDFGPYCPDIKGITPEPTPDHIKQYWLAIQAGMRSDRNEILEWQDRMDAITGTDAKSRERRHQIEEEYAVFQDKQTDTRFARRREALAALCQNQPSLEELERLPGRVFDDFERYMQDEISPKGSKNDSN